MKHKTFFFTAFALLLALGLTAQDIISAKAFVELQKSGEEFVLLDANKSKNYAASHIKGAIHVNHNDLYKDDAIKGLILEPEQLAEKFGALGVGNDSKVIITDDGSQKYNSRVYWILKYLGKEDVHLLHKDLDAWRKARIALTSSATKAEPRTFTPKVNKMVLATMKDVEAAIENPDVIVVDSRTADEYNGVSKSKGHIPGAVHLNYEDMLTENGAFKSKEALKKIAMEYGLTEDKELIFYCRTSVRATVAYAALKNILGYDNVRVYDGAYLEWAANHSVVQ